jgi:Cof subfamily protein (haloacid dehalogenase superfamily)
MDNRIKNRTYKMIALDLDGTLTNSEKKISKRTYEKLMEAQEQGMCVVLASGRPDLGMSHLADELHLERFGGYVLAFNGAKIINWQTKEIVYALPVPPESLKEICRISAQYHLPLLAHEDDHLIVQEPDNPYIIEEARINQMQIQTISDYESYVDFPIYKFIAVGDGPYLAQMEPLVKAALEPACAVYRSTAFFLEIVGQGVDKAEGIMRLAGLLGISREEVIACGDGYNDISMIEKAGLGVAMANAEPEVKAVADYITASNDEDGIADLLEEILPGKEA